MKANTKAENHDHLNRQQAEKVRAERANHILQGLSAVSGIPCRVVKPEENPFSSWKEMRKGADVLCSDGKSTESIADGKAAGRKAAGGFADNQGAEEDEGGLGNRMPLLFTRDMKIFWAVIRTEKVIEMSDYITESERIAGEDRLVSGSEADSTEYKYLLTGPVSIRPLTEGQLRRFYLDYGLTPGDGTQPHVLPFRTFLHLVVTQAAVLGSDLTAEEIMKANDLPDVLLEDSSRREQILFEMAAEREEIDHHSYEEERYLLQCVREGKTDEALRQNAAMDLQMGRMSKKETDQWRKTVTVAVTLCSRAAIEGGISPAQAYQISDYYLQKSDSCRTPEELAECRNQAVRELTDMVHARNTGRRTSSYVEQCRDYVRKNYKRKIYVGDIADALGISETYLSRLFSRETGERLQDYISKVRVEKAANLLIYSDESIADIAEYCCFPSQSYFGHVFLKFKGMPPNRFRDRYKPAEFRERD